MLDFKNVSATEALRYAKELSGLSAKELAEKGKLTPYIDRIYSVYDTPKAIQYILTNHAQGKIVITMDF